MDMSMIIVNFHIPEELKDHYQQKADNAYRSLASVLREVLLVSAGIEITRSPRAGKAERESRMQEMESLRNSGKTLEEIGQIYGISRERVRQIIGNTGQVAHKKREEEYESMIPEVAHLTNGELENQDGIVIGPKFSMMRAKTRHAIDPESSVGVGYKWEEWVSEQLTKRGIEHEMMIFRSPYDIQVGKYKVEVKSTATRADLMPSQYSASPTYHFNIGKEVKDRVADFYIFVIQPEEVAFIVPAEKLPKAVTTRIAYPSEKSKKYKKYFERWDLLLEQEHTPPALGSPSAIGG